MDSKKCFKCKQVLPLDAFYKHKAMSDGHLNKCKLCAKKDVSENYIKNCKSEEFIEKERLRGREKYKRLNYKDRFFDEARPWKKHWLYKSLSKIMKTDRGVELHHWNYNEDFLDCIFFVDRKNHKLAHRFLKLDIKSRLFLDENGNKLDTKEKHFLYLLSKGVKVSYERINIIN